MKRVLASLVVASFLPLSACRPGTTDVHVASANELAPGITVTGTGEALAEPDVARASIGVEIRSAVVTDAVTEANQRMNAVVGALKGLGIDAKDLQTHDFSIQYEPRPIPEPPPPEPRPTPAKPGAPVVESAPRAAPQGDYRVTNMLSVTVRDLAKVGQVFDTAMKAGANNVWGLVFELDDPKPLRAQARVKAVADARKRAEELAQSSGTQIGAVRAIEEIDAGGPVVLGVARMQAEGAGVPIERGQVSINVQVRVVFDLAGRER
jgi:uncharacterized protein YggE